ncbi:hypothetical protein EUTSA_v10027749mg [Eutrema salsugineum]|uniref:Uncharacterized protein n=1 Tax=Eutrema salsugineum TaxID=72664 RepID=V4LWB2_EUTSA|nr:uncharacterized protein LOC18022962 [Eutrema salsugineum]ESQ46817.1 hypothetical protein EUTSA_v10027749mg [Eutrema salsugineum]
MSPRFREKWDFRRQENNFDDSSSDDPDSTSTQDPLIHNPNLVLDSNQIDSGAKTVTKPEQKQPVKTRKRMTRKKDESKPEKAKQVRRRKPKTVCAEDTKKKEETVLEKEDDIGMFMKTLLDDLTASRESLMDWMKTELHGSSDQNVMSRPPPKKRAVASVAAQRSVKKRGPKKKESEKQSKPEELCQAMNKPIVESSEIAQNGGSQVQELDYNAGPLEMFLKSGQGSLDGNYYQQQEQVQRGIVAQTEMVNEKNATVTNPKSVVLAIQAPQLSQKQKKTRDANTIKNRSSMTGSETQKKGDNFVTPSAQKLSPSPSLQSFPVGSSSLNSFFPSSSQGTTSFASDNNFQLRQPPVNPIHDLSDLQTGFTGGQGFGNSLLHNNGYFSGFPAAFQPNLIGSSYNFPTQVNPATSSQQRDNNNMFGGLRMAGEAISFSGGRFPESEVGDSNNGFSDHRTSSGR